MKGRSTMPVPIGIDGNIRVFMSIFPAGFSDPTYIGGIRRNDRGERAYKLAAAKQLHDRILSRRPWDLESDAAVKDLASAGVRVVSASQNLLYTTEAIAFNESVRDIPAARAYFSALFKVLDAPMPAFVTFEPYIAAIESLPSRESGTSPAKWPVLTLFPYLAQPDRHIFVKPLVTRSAAKSMGFPLKLIPRLSWSAYGQVLDMAHRLLEALAPVGARDMIDVQSFIWVTQRRSYPDGESSPDAGSE